MLNIEISANDYQGKKEHCLNVKIDDERTTFSFNKQTTSHDMAIQKLDKLMNNYYQRYSNGQSIKECELYKELKLDSRAQIDIDIVRIFIISYKDINILKKNIKKIQKRSGDTKGQFNIDFVKKEYVTKYKKAIEKFYNLGLLYKYLKINGKDDDVEYIFPFIKNNQLNIREFNLIPYNMVWNKIIQERK